MNIYIPVENLKKLSFNLRVVEGKLNIKGFTNEELKGKICPDCLFKSFKKSETITIETLTFNRGCSCNLKISPIIDLKISTRKNPEVVFV